MSNFLKDWKENRAKMLDSMIQIGLLSLLNIIVKRIDAVVSNLIPFCLGINYSSIGISKTLLDI